jgi:transposase InsO family protein
LLSASPTEHRANPPVAVDVALVARDGAPTDEVLQCQGSLLTAAPFLAGTVQAGLAAPRRVDVVKPNPLAADLNSFSPALPPSFVDVFASNPRSRDRPGPTRGGIDMTKVMIEGFGWVYLVVVLDWYSKKVVGHYAGLQARAWHWLVALNRAVNRQFPDGIEGQGVNLMADNGCQSMSLAFMRACAAMGIKQAFTSYSNPKGNADTERFLRTLNALSLLSEDQRTLRERRQTDVNDPRQTFSA